MITPANVERAFFAAHQLTHRLSQLRGHYAFTNCDHPDMADHVAKLHRDAEAQFAALVDALGNGCSFQERVGQWMSVCFGRAITADQAERNYRFLEEALELVQSCGCTANEAHQLVDYVFGRPIGEKEQEVGGVTVTLAALCNAQNIDIAECSETELRRVWTKVEQIRAKQAAKPKHSPLPGPSAAVNGKG